MKNLLLEKISNEEIIKNIKKLYSFLKKELPKIDRDPKVFFRQDKNNSNDILGKTGYYDPSTDEIHLYITDRHGKDILRSFAHEVIHHEQNCSGLTFKLDMSKTKEVDYAEKDEGLREAERDAFERGNMLFRKWTDRLKAKRKKRKKGKRIMNESKLRTLINQLVKEVLQEKSHLNDEKNRKHSVKKAKIQGKKDASEDFKNISGNDIKEESDFPHDALFEQKERILQEAFNKRESEIYSELIKKFIV